MTKQHRILVGEGMAEPTSGFELALKLFDPNPIEFYFGVRRSPKGLSVLDRDGVTITANFPGRGMSQLSQTLKNCNLSSYNVSRALLTKRLVPDALITVASPPDKNGIRYIGAANGPIQSAIDNSPFIIIEEYPDLPIIAGTAQIPSDKKVHVLPHTPAPYASLSRQPAEIDYKIATHITTLIKDNVALQLGVGGIIEALGHTLEQKNGLRIISGAIGTAIQNLHKNNCLDINTDILGTALVGDQDLIDWAIDTKNIRLMPSQKIHNPRWLGEIPNFYSVNIALTVDLEGNINAEKIGDRRVSGRGGSPDFAKGASASQGGKVIVALRADRDNCLVEKIEKPTISSHYVDYIVCEKGIADLQGKSKFERAKLLQDMLG